MTLQELQRLTGLAGDAIAIVAQTEDLAGKPIEFAEDESLSPLAGVRMARSPDFALPKGLGSTLLVPSSARVSSTATPDRTRQRSLIPATVVSRSAPETSCRASSGTLIVRRLPAV